MRHNNFVFILALVIISSIVYSCDKDKLEDSVVPMVIENKEENNEVHNQLIDSLDAESGIVQYDRGLSAWIISVYEKGAIDKVCVYFPQVLNKEYQKDGLPITVSGRVYNLSDSLLANIPQVGGHEYHALDITSICEDTVKVNELVGTWYLSKADYLFGGIQTFASDEIILNFYNYGLLVIQDTKDRESPPFSSVGVHKYNVDKERGTVTIDATMFWYVIKNNTLTIGLGATYDAPLYVFQRGGQTALEETGTPGQSVGSIDAESGIVQYDRGLSAWIISVYEKGAIDKVCVYFPQVLNKEYQKDGLPITVSGRVYNLSDSLLANIPQVGGHEYHALDITSICEDTVKVNELVGTWYLSKADYHFGGTETFASDEFSFSFYNHDILVIHDMRDRKDIPFSGIGVHKYNVDKEKGTITIDSSTSWYRIDHNTLTIDTGSAWDAPVYVFQRQ